MLPLMMLGFLLTLSLCDADDTCSPVLKTLILNPPKLITEYGEHIHVNCSLIEEEPEEMTLLIGTHQAQSEIFDSSVSIDTPLTDWNAKGECKIKLNESVECSQEIEIIVYKIPEVVLSVKTVKVLSEKTTYELQCDVFNAAPVQNLTIKWFKNNETIDTKSFSETTRIPVNKSSSLEVDVSWEDSIAQLRCEGQLELEPPGPQHPVVSQTHSLSALYYAPEFLVNHSRYISVSKGDDVSLSCEADGNPAPEYQWTADDGGDVLNTSSELSLTKVNNSAVYTCTATNDLGNITLSVLVSVPQVTPAAADPSPEAPAQQACSLTVTPSEVVVKFGGPVVINCSTSSADVGIMGWESSVGGNQESFSPVTLKIEKLEAWNLDPYCFVTLHNGKQCVDKPIIHLYKTPDFVSVSAVSPGPMKEGSEYQLKCNIINVAPVHKLIVKWYQGNKTVHTDDVKFSHMSPHNFSSRLNVTSKKSDNGSLFRCEVELQLGPTGPEIVPSAASEPYVAVVLYKPLINCPHKPTVQENRISLNNLSCEIDGNPPPAVQWYRDGKVISSDETLSRTHSGSYTAEVTNSMGKSSTSVFITVEYRPSFTCGMHYEVEVNEEPKPLCEPEGLPPPNITWFRNGKKAILPERWTKHDSGNYSLHSHNNHGRATHKFTLDILYAPEFKEGNIREVLIPGGNVTFSCSAEGNPRPEIKWSYRPAGNLKETTEGHQRIVTVTGATSTNAGLYICVATNKVGNVTKTVSLAERDKTSEMFWWLLILPVILIVLGILYLLIYYRRRRRGQYTFISSTNGSSIPMTANSAGKTEIH